MPAWTVVRETDFQWQMEYLRSQFDIVTMAEALKRVNCSVLSTRPFALVTFDDGYRGNFDTVLPIMEKMGLPFLVYVATEKILNGGLYWHDQVINLLSSKIDLLIEIESNKEISIFNVFAKNNEYQRWEAMEKLLSFLKGLSGPERIRAVTGILEEYGQDESHLRMMDEAELRRLASSNCVTVGSHTHGHELLDQLTSEQVVESLRTSGAHIRRITGQFPCHFAYPNGNFNEETVAVVGAAGYHTATTTCRGIWTPHTTLLKIPRLAIGRFETKALFKSRISGFL